MRAAGTPEGQVPTGRDPSLRRQPFDQPDAGDRSAETQATFTGPSIETPFTVTPPEAPIVATLSRVTAPHPDALLDALVTICRLHGVSVSRESLSAGLPLPPEGMSVALAERAAQRAGMATKLLRVKLKAMETKALPAVLLLRDRGACVLLGFGSTGEAKLLLPQAGMARIKVSADELASRYTGVALFVRPKFRFDNRTNAASRTHRSGHWFWSAISAQRSVYRDVLWAAALINVFAIALPMFTMNVYDRVVPNAAMETLWALAIGVVVAITADWLMRALRSRFVDEASARIDVDLSARLMEQVMHLRMEHKPASVGSFASTLRGFEQVRDFIASSTVTALVDLPFGLMFMALIIWIAPWLALPVALAFGMTVGMGWLLQHRLHALAESTYRASAQRNATLVESVAGLETLKAQGAEGGIQAKWERANTHLAGVSIQMRSLSSRAMLTAQWLAQLSSVVVVLVGVYLITERQLTMGALIAVSMLASRALAPSAQIVGLLLQYQGARTALDGLDALMKLPIERPLDTTDPGERPTPFVSRGTMQGAIAFRNVKFSYPGRDDAALNDVSFSIQPGEVVAFLGRAGSGKSTIQRLMLGLYQSQEGSVMVDGVDVRQLDPAELRRQVASVAQDALLFYGSLRENIALTLPHADDAEVLAAAQAAGLAPFINRHPLGMAMPVGERGELLSGGQRQGVAMARALLHGGSMLCLDEPTSALDQSTEAWVVQQLREHAKGRTVLIATHRRSLLPLATRVIVLDEGRVVADGPRDKILKLLDGGTPGARIVRANPANPAGAA